MMLNIRYWLSIIFLDLHKSVKTDFTNELHSSTATFMNMTYTFINIAYTFMGMTFGFINVEIKENNTIKALYF